MSRQLYIVGSGLIILALSWHLWLHARSLDEPGTPGAPEAEAPEAPGFLCIAAPSTVVDVLAKSSTLPYFCDFCRPVVPDCGALSQYDCLQGAMKQGDKVFNCAYSDDGTACVAAPTTCRLDMPPGSCRQANASRACSDLTADVCNFNAQMSAQEEPENCWWNGTACTAQRCTQLVDQGASCFDCVSEVGENNYRCSSDVPYCDTTTCTQFLVPLQKFCAQYQVFQSCSTAQYPQVPQPCLWVPQPGKCQKFEQRCETSQDCCGDSCGCYPIVGSKTKQCCDDSYAIPICGKGKPPSGCH